MIVLFLIGGTVIVYSTNTLMQKRAANLQARDAYFLRKITKQEYVRSRLPTDDWKLYRWFGCVLVAGSFLIWRRNDSDENKIGNYLVVFAVLTLLFIGSEPVSTSMGIGNQRQPLEQSAQPPLNNG